MTDLRRQLDESRDREIAALRRENAELRARLDYPIGEVPALPEPGHG